MVQDPTPVAVDSQELAHFVTYGQPGVPSPHRVSPTDWSTEPFTSAQTSPWDIPLTSTQLTALVNGFNPREMEDKWFVCSEGEVSEGKIVNVGFYRSWTGRKIWMLEIVVGKEGGRVRALVWEGNEEVVGEQDFDSAKEGVREVGRWVLGMQLEGEE
ncbi:hypothetical protein N431DRAFT_379201 [Stipitochalara longipes BDJ]|nr:hypothetical protein N431DRAFT_379201 [Stipitochalara longipes BDJ]